MSAIYLAKSGARSAPTLPVDAVTRTFGIFGMKDSGKTTTARVLIEGICKTGGHAIVFDPVGVWWGATRAGSGPGIPGVVLGGEHGDAPLEETGGKLVAELALARQYRLIVVDLKLLRKGAAQRFMADCLEELYFRNRRPLNVVFEEADRALPQTTRGADIVLNRVIGAAEDIVKLGRSRGLGSTVISQRLATVNKNVTEQTENMILMRMIGPNDRKAVKGWIESNGDPTITAKVLDSMASLRQGEAWMYSPGWLRLLERIRVRAAKTLDTSATPTSEQAQVEKAAKRAPISLDELRTRMAETIERAKENDPAELRKRLTALQRENETLRAVPAPEPQTETQLVYPWSDGELDAAIEKAEAAINRAGEAREQAEAAMKDAAGSVEAGSSLLAALRRWREAMDDEIATLDQVVVKAVGNRIAPQASRAAQTSPPARSPERSPDSSASGAEPVSGPQQRILDALAWFASIGVDMPRRSPLGAVCGVSPKSSGFEKNLSTLRTKGLIEYPDRGRVKLSEQGSAAANAPETPASEAELQEAICRMVSGPQAAILRTLIRVYPQAMSREELAGRVEVSPASSGFEKNLSTLRSFELAAYPSRGYVVATDLLFVG